MAWATGMGKMYHGLAAGRQSGRRRPWASQASRQRSLTDTGLPPGARQSFSPRCGSSTRPFALTSATCASIRTHTAASTTAVASMRTASAGRSSPQNQGLGRPAAARPAVLGRRAPFSEPAIAILEVHNHPEEHAGRYGGGAGGSQPHVIRKALERVRRSGRPRQPSRPRPIVFQFFRPIPAATIASPCR